MEDTKRWPLHEKIVAAGPAYGNTAKKVRHSLRQFDRILDVFEPGQLAFSFNGGKDSTALLHLLMEACAHHPTHNFAHVQPIWFQDPEHEFPEMIEYVHRTAAAYFTHPNVLGITDQKLNRLWSIHVNSAEDFMKSLTEISRSNSISCVMMGSRRTDPGSRDLTPLALMDLAPVFLSSTLTRMKLEAQLNMFRSDGDPGLPGTGSSPVKEPPLMRFSPLLEWSYRDVWDFILAAEVEYCSLYRHGYSSVGTTRDTVKNPFLLRANSAAHRRRADVGAGLHASGAPWTLQRFLGQELFAEVESAKARDFERFGVAIYDPHFVAPPAAPPPPQDATGGAHADPGRMFSPTDEDIARGVTRATEEEDSPEPLAQEAGEVGEWLPAWLLEDESKEGLSRLQQQQGPRDVPAADGVNQRWTMLGDEIAGGATVEQGETAAIIVVGDELLSGALRESNSHFISSSLRSHGIAVKQVLLIESDIDVIAFLLRRLSPVHRHVFVAGGVGPAHTDVTLAAVSKAFGVGMTEHAGLLRLVSDCTPRHHFSEHHLRMAYVPYGAELVGKELPVPGEVGDWSALTARWPSVKKNNVYVLPTRWPHILRKRFSELLPLLQSAFEPFASTRITFRASVEKAQVAASIVEALKAHPKVASHTFAESVGGETRTVLYLESKDPAQQTGASDMVLGLIPPEWVQAVVHSTSDQCEWKAPIKE